MSALTDLMVKDWHVGVSPDSIITTEEMIKEFDLKTERAVDIDFESEFCLSATLPGFKQFNVSINLFLKIKDWHTLVQDEKCSRPLLSTTHSSFS